MGKIEVNTKELETSINELLSKTQEVSAGGYVTSNLFQEMESSSSETLDDMLETLVKSACQMEGIIKKTASFFREVIDGFETEDKTLANKINATNSKSGKLRGK